MKQLTDEQIEEMARQEQLLLVCDDLEALTEIVRATERALAALATAQPVQVNAMLVGALQAAEKLEHEALVALSEATYELKVGNTHTTATDTYKAHNDLIHRLDKILNSQYRDRKRAALTAAQQAQPEPSEMTEEREAYIAGLESRTHEMRKKIEQLDYELRVARSSQERATYTPPKIIDPDAPHPCFN